MKRLILALILTACAHQETREETLQRVLPAHHRPSPVSRSTVRNEPRPAPTTATPEPTETPEARCTRTRPTRVAQVKEEIRTFRARMKEIGPVAAFALEHKCELRDNRGTVLVTRKREAGGVRVGVQRGTAEELVCDTTKIPAGLTVDVMREIALLDATAEDSVMFETLPECDATERPSLRLRANDVAGQDAVLSLP